MKTRSHGATAMSHDSEDDGSWIEGEKSWFDDEKWFDDDKTWLDDLLLEDEQS